MSAHGVLTGVATITRVAPRASWFMLRAGGLVVHIDPHSPPDAHGGVYALAPEAQEQADLVLVTHSDRELCQPSVMDKLLGPGTIVVAPQRCDQVIRSDHLVATPGESVDLGSLTLEVVQAYTQPHSGLLERVLHHKGEGVGYVLMLAAHRVYHAGATDFIPEMRGLGAVDVAMLPIGGGFMLGADEAVEATLAIAPKVVIPMHESDRDVAWFKREVEARSAVQVVLLEAGETFTFKK
jgi:L-ascorbate metabolism protein UlaG (beta-lactamase superfamily)